MRVFAVGDIHGCYYTFCELLKKMEYQYGVDKLILLGDLVNKGANSKKVLEWVLDHPVKVTSLMGNHDLHLLCYVLGITKKLKFPETKDILDSSRKNEFEGFIKSQKLLIKMKNDFFIHAGVLPNWSLKELQNRATDCEQALSSDLVFDVLKSWKKDKPKKEEPEKGRVYDLALTLSVLTRARTIDKNGHLNLKYWDSVENTPDHLTPWYLLRNESEKARFIFGHWAMHGKVNKGVKNAIALDTGCVYGGVLTAIELESNQVYEQSLSIKD
ncbi:MAG: symmetrical bis(5'-nucleosyl)-tetraphosphatase [Bacteriovoracaceae bacterium]|nr:symmetrical bis(5'-nucleosyl)-tetraphosphatase [Bacteriovoracaceae bacterium]